MSGSVRRHYLKGEPEFELWPGSDKFSCYYDYDQLRDRKLSALTDQQKALWFKKRIEMTFVNPLRAIFRDPESETFKELMNDKLTPPRSLSIGIMSMMLNGVESLGSFIEPALGMNSGDNKKMFEAFVERYLPMWWRTAVPSGTPNITDLLWKCFRNGVAHGFQIAPPGSLEFLENEPYRWEPQMKVVQVCPLHFFRDLERGVNTYLSDLQLNQDIQQKFIQRFRSTYPS